MGIWKPTVPISICMSYALWCLFTMPAVPFTEPDSAGYLALEPIHTLGYPLFLKVLGAKGAIVAQPLIFAAALAGLGVETLRATSSVALSSGVVIASIVIPDLATYHASILTESLFMSGLVFLLAATIRFVREPSWQTAVLAAIIAGVSATVRRTGVAFFPALPAMVFLQWRRLPENRLTILVAATLPMLGVALTERIAARAIHGDNLTSLMGRHVFAKAALIEAPPPSDPHADPLRARLEDALDVEFAPIRHIINRAPPGIRGVLTLYYEGCLQTPCIRELRRSIPLSDARLNEPLFQVGLERISSAPLNFARLTATDYRSFWTAYNLRHPETAAILNAFIASNRPLPFERDAFALNSQDTLEFRSSEPVRFVQPVVMLIGWITGGFALLGLTAAASRRLLSQALSVACLASLTAHGGLLFSALLAAGISRFIISLWPAIMTAMLFAAWWAFGELSGRGAAHRT